MVAELSRLGRNMLQALNIINELSEKGVKIAFVRQPELSTTGQQAQFASGVLRRQNLCNGMKTSVVRGKPRSELL
jgi:DNA invertase Pin-like site-specific DNA recombinase